LSPTRATLDWMIITRDDTPPQDRARLAESIRGYKEADAARLRRAVQAGVPIAAGSDHNYYNTLTGKTRRQMTFDVLQAYAEAGMSPLEIIRAGTINAAELLGRPDIGAIETNKFADVIAVPGDPLKDISQ